MINSFKCPYPLWADGSRWARGAAGSRVTHLHLRRASSLQTASYTFSRLDYPNFERSCRSDVKQISGRVANPVSSPQPVVGIHFEVIIGGLIVIPPCFSNSLGEPHIHPGSQRERARAHRHTNTRTNTHKHNVTRSGKVSAAVVFWAAVSVPRSLDPHGDADDAFSKFSRSTSPERRCHQFFPPPRFRTVVIIIPNQLLHRARLCDSTEDRAS